MPLAMQSARTGAQMLHLSLDLYEVYDITTLNVAFVQLTKNRPDGLLVPGDAFLVSQRGRIAQFAIENKLPSVYSLREHVEAGGLIAYTPNYHDLFRRAASYMDKILKGTKPGELPIEQPTKFHLVINPNTARALGLTVPPRLLAIADEVIE
jgi:putative ABC transport system substrate-binding protein